MKIAVSIPDELYGEAETLAKRLRLSRSGLYATALQDFLAKHHAKKITERLNAVYTTEDSRLHRSLRRAQLRTVARDRSKW